MGETGASGNGSEDLSKVPAPFMPVDPPDPIRPPGPIGVVVLLARLALRRWINKLGAVRRRRDPAPGAPRTGTARKSTGSASWLFLMGIIFFISSVNVSFQFLFRLREGVEAPERESDRIDVSVDAYKEIIKAHFEWNRENTPESHREILHRLESLFSRELARGGVPERGREERISKMIEIFRTSRAEGFRSHAEFPWIRAVGCVLLLLCLSQVWLSLGTGNQDLGRVEWSLEWLFTFPAPAGRLFLAKIFEYTIVNPFGWFMILPFLLTAMWTSGWHARAIPVAVGATLFLALVLSSIRLVTETWLRIRLSLNRLKNLQAGCTLVGMILWLGILWVALAHPTPPFFLELAPRLPQAALWNPFSIPVLLLQPGISPWAAGGAMAALGVLFPLAAVGACRRFVRNGLLTTSGTFEGVRHPTGAPGERLERSSVFKGVLAKDLRLLLRDRNFFVQTVILPVLVFALQMAFYPNLLKGVTGDYRHAATFAFGLGAYVLMSSAFHVLTVEGNSLWLLYTFPRELHSILLQKTIVWAGVALLYSGLALGITAAFSRALDWSALSLGVTAAVGVGISAFIASALGVLATDPLQRDQPRKIRPEIVYLYMILSGLYGYAIYGPETWPRLVQVVLSALLVLALWQKVRDRLPYLLDPTEMPPPRIALSDGLIAILFFFVLQGLMAMLALTAGVPEKSALLLLFSYTASGGVVAFFTLYLFWRLHVPKLLEAVGFRSPEGSVGRALLFGAIAGLVGAGIGRGYLEIVRRVEPLRNLLHQEQPQSLSGWIVVLAVVAAPVFEEYLFRGLVYKGMRRTMRPAMAVLASAGLFAIVHPPVSFVPVFSVGILTAIAFERSKLLLAPMLAHAIYNASMVLLSAGGR